MLFLLQQPGLVLQTSLPSVGAPSAVVYRGQSFQLRARLEVPSKYLGGSKSELVRFDLVPGGIRASKMSNNKKVWYRKCSDATLLGGKIHLLESNNLYQCDESGNVLSRRRLTRSSITWTSLDPSLRFALGFRDKPTQSNSWPMFIIRLSDMRVYQLPIVVDLGGHVEPSVVSGSSFVLIYDLLYCYSISFGTKKPVVTSTLGKDFYVQDSLLNSNGLFFLVSNSDNTLTRLINYDTGAMLETKQKIDGFVKNSKESIYVYSFLQEGGVNVFRAEVPTVVRSAREPQQQTLAHRYGN